MSDAWVEFRLNLFPMIFPSFSTFFHHCASLPRLRFVNGYLLWISFILAAAFPAALLTCEDINFLPGSPPLSPHLQQLFEARIAVMKTTGCFPQRMSVFVEDNGGVWMTGVRTSWM